MKGPRSKDAVTALLEWYRLHARPLPWRQSPTPYHVLLSEIMLQQTRIEACREAYARFLRVYPTIQELADGDDETLLKLWEGLGYYSRARNLKKAAIAIAKQGFPETATELRRLPGIGPYTAGAISSIAFHHPAVAIDGNVLRVLSRLLARNVSRDDAEGFLAPRIPADQAADFTQAWMELGETVCIPNAAPLCGQCPLAAVCRAKGQGCQEQFPQRTTAKPRRQENRLLLLLLCNRKIGICKREATGLLAQMWELPGLEMRLDSLASAPPPEIRKRIHPAPEEWRAVKLLKETRHVFSHVEWHLQNLLMPLQKEREGFLWVTPEELREKYALPSAFRPSFRLLQKFL